MGFLLCLSVLFSNRTYSQALHEWESLIPPGVLCIDSICDYFYIYPLVSRLMNFSWLGDNAIQRSVINCPSSILKNRSRSLQSVPPCWNITCQLATKWLVALCKYGSIITGTQFWSLWLAVWFFSRISARSALVD